MPSGILSSLSSTAIRRLATRLTIAAASTAISLLLAEGALRLYRPLSAFGGGTELEWMRQFREGFGEIITTDPELGFRPNLGNGIYSQYGTMIPGWDTERRSGTTRVLFIGDSVTQRGKILRPLRKLYGTEQFEYWNAGVGSFNTIQEVEFYKRYNANIEPDHVVLFFHLNDFETTPIAFFNDGELITFAPNQSIHTLNPWLFRKSAIYRAYIGLRVSEEEDRKRIDEEVAASLADLTQKLAKDGIRFSTVILPYFIPHAKWPEGAGERRAQITEILEELNVRTFDLFDPTQRAIAEGIDVQQSPGDFWHPSNAAGRLLAESLYQQGLLAN